MLKEKIIYKDELPINVVTASIDEYPIHFHDGGGLCSGRERNS